MIRLCACGLLLGLILAPWACGGIIDVAGDAAVGEDAAASEDAAVGEDVADFDCHDPDGDEYGSGVDCLGPDCDETNPQCWQPGDSCCRAGPYGTCGTGGPIGECQQVSLPSGEYFVYAPPIDPDNPLPMVMALHGDEGSPHVAIRYFWGPVWTAVRDFILVLPQCPAANGSWWNSDTQANADFIDDVIDDVAGKFNVDIDRAYAIGYSGGSTWLAWHGFQFQDVFAGIQWSCGGAYTRYTAPPRDTCKVDGRFNISDDDFLWDGARDVYETMLAYGHEAEWVTAQCSGHCCAPGKSEAEEALQWFLGRTKCDGTAGSGCGDIRDLP
jgi:predicted esterase